jgi:hypothetical protein
VSIGQIHREQVDRVTIQCSSTETLAARDWLKKYGYTLTQEGPKQAEHGTVDLSTSVVTGERARTGTVELWTKNVLGPR